MKYLCLALFSACLLTVSLAAFLPANAQSVGEKKEEPKKEEPKKDEPKKEEPAKGEEKKADDKKAEEKKDEEKTYDIPDTYGSLMKRIRTQDRKIKRSVSTKDADSITGSTDMIRFYATQIASLDKSKDKRNEKEDYLKWAKELEEKSRDVRKMAEEKKPDWDKIGTAYEDMKKVCASCHKVYAPDED